MISRNISFCFPLEVILTFLPKNQVYFFTVSTYISYATLLCTFQLFLYQTHYLIFRLLLFFKQKLLHASIKRKKATICTVIHLICKLDTKIRVAFLFALNQKQAFLLLIIGNWFKKTVLFSKFIKAQMDKLHRNKRINIVQRKGVNILLYCNDIQQNSTCKAANILLMET